MIYNSPPPPFPHYISIQGWLHFIWVPLILLKLLRIYIIGKSPLFDQKFWTYNDILWLKPFSGIFFPFWQLIPNFMTWNFSELWRFVNLLPPNQRKAIKKKTQETHDSEYQRILGSLKLPILIDPSLNIITIYM